MSASFLLRHFDRLAEAPGGSAKLRALILQLAVRGNLVRSETSESWQSLKLGQLAEVIRGVSYDKSVVRNASENGYVPLLRANAIQGSLVFDDLVYVPASYVSKEQFVRKNDLVIAMSSGSKDLVGKAAQAQEDFPGGFGAFCGVIRFGDRVEPGYARVFVQSPLYRDAIAAEGRGIGINNLRKDSLLDLPFPLPPLAAQRRIVAKVEELMGLCDALEAAQQEREAVRTRLRTSALHQLVSPDPDSKSAAFVLQNLPCFTAAPEDFASLRDAVRDAAVLGLFSADSSSWKRAKLGELTALVTSGSRGWAEYYSNSGALFVRAQNIKKNGRLMLDSVAYVDLPKNSEGTRTRIERDDLVVVITGVGVTQSAHVQEDLDEAYVSQHVALIRMKERAHAPWISLQFLAKASAQGQLDAQIYGGKPALNLTNIRELEIPLPPLAEQRRIVAKVDELMAVLDALEATLTTARTTSEKLLAATVAKLHAA